jgi:hypothetical protein
MNAYAIERIDHKNAGIAREWSMCRHHNVIRTAHDNLAYDKGSDLDTADGKHISIKASAFTLMSGSLCEGRDTFDGIWELYAERVHSDTFAYITADFTVYEMTLDEFKCFVYTFAHTERESEKNGGALKIRLRKESGKMLKWLADKAAA